MAASFAGAAWSRVAFASTLIGSLFLSPETKLALDLDLGRVLAHGEVWRLVTHHLAFDSLGEAAVGLICIYRFRNLERMLGSRKFGAFVLLTCSLSSAIATAVVVSLGASRRDAGVAFLRLASGPYALVFGSFALYSSLVPSLRQKLVGLGPVDLSDKSLTYLAGAQLLASGGLRSLVPGCCGLVMGAAYLADTLRLYTLALPKRAVFWRRAPDARRPIAPDHAPVPSAVPLSANAPSDENVESLVAMGFDRDRSLAALTAADNNLEIACNRLLSG